MGKGKKRKEKKNQTSQRRNQGKCGGVAVRGQEHFKRRTSSTISRTSEHSDKGLQMGTSLTAADVGSVVREAGEQDTEATKAVTWSKATLWPSCEKDRRGAGGTRVG